MLDHTLFRHGLRALLESVLDVELVGEASTGDEAIVQVQALDPDVVLMDINMPDLNGIAATRQIMDARPTTAVVMLTMHAGDDSLFAAMRAGARGYVLKGADETELLRVVRAAARGEALFGPAIAQRLMHFFGDQRTRESEFPQLNTHANDRPRGGALVAERSCTVYRRLTVRQLPCAQQRFIVVAKSLVLLPCLALVMLAGAAAPFPTQTPIPIQPSRPGGFPYGVASGDMTPTSAILWTRTGQAADLAPELSTEQSFSSPVALTATRSTDASDFTVRVTADHLIPGTTYYYRFRSQDAVSDIGSFRTAFPADQDAPVTIGFTGDAHWSWKPYPLLASLVKEPLDTFVFLGDLIYESRNLETGKNGSIAAESLDDFRAKYRENREPRAGGASDMVPMRDLYARFGQYSVFDNHETANSKARGAPPYITGGASVDGQFVNQTEGFRNRIQAYSEYQPVQDTTVQATGDPRADGTQMFYRAVGWGANVELFILDDRSYRDAALAKASDPAAADCARTMLGAPQLSWFETQLLAAQSHRVAWKVVVISSPIEELGKEFDGTKAWPAGYACERNRLLQFIDANAINNVVFLTTDNHYTVVNNLTYNADPADPTSPLLPARNAFEILTGPLGADVDPIDQTHNVDVYGLSLRDADRKIVDTWNGDVPDMKGNVDGLRQQGFDPIGLEPSFPGLVPSSVVAAGMQNDQIIAADFVSFRTFSYAVLNFDHTSLSVRVMGIPAVLDPTQLFDPTLEQAYERQEAHEILRFRVLAQ